MGSMINCLLRTCCGDTDSDNDNDDNNNSNNEEDDDERNVVVQSLTGRHRTYNNNRISRRRSQRGQRHRGSSRQQQQERSIYSDSTDTFYDPNNGGQQFFTIPRSHSRIFRSAGSTVEDCTDCNSNNSSEFVRIYTPDMLSNDSMRNELRQEPESALSIVGSTSTDTTSRQQQLQQRNLRASPTDRTATFDDDDDEYNNTPIDSDDGGVVGRTNPCCRPAPPSVRDSLSLSTNRADTAHTQINTRTGESSSGPGNMRGSLNTVRATPRLPPEAKPHVDSINSFFRKIRDKFHTTTTTTYDSFTTVAASWNNNTINNNNNNNQPHNNAAARRGNANLHHRTPSSSSSSSAYNQQHQLHDALSVLSHSGYENNDGSSSGNDGNIMSNTTSRPIRIASRNCFINSPLRQAERFDISSNDNMISISPAEIVLPGSLLQREMAEKMKAALDAEKETKRQIKLKAKNDRRESALIDVDEYHNTTDALNKLKSTIDEMQVTDNSSNIDECDDDDECVICMEGFDPTNPRMPTLCGCGENKTYFHLPCLYQWIEQSKNCPTCRKELAWEEY